MGSPDPFPELADVYDAISRAGKSAGGAIGSLLTHSALGIAIWDTTLRCVWVNDAMERYDRISRKERLGRFPRDALAGDADRLESVIERVLATGIHVTGREYRVPAAVGGVSEGAVTATFIRLSDAEDVLLGVAQLVHVKDRRWPEDRLAVVSESGSRIGTSLDVMRTAQELADFVVPFFADYVTVDLTEAVRLGEEPLERLGPSDGRIPTFRRAGRASIHAGAPESLWPTGEVVYVPETSPFMEVLSSGRPLLEPVLDVHHAAWLSKDPARAQKIREFGMHSLLVLPIHARGVLMGVAVFVRTENPASFDENDQLLAEELVARTALSLDNARRYARERTAALTLQHSLLPRRIRGGEALQVAARYLPADAEYSVGGDWFDVIGLSGGRLALVVGDVVGHGIEAAATMGRLRTAIRTLAGLDMSPGELLTRLDQTFARLVEDEGDTHEEIADPAVPSISATCVYALYEPVRRTCEVALAGHPSPAIVHPHGDVTFPELPRGTPLGLGMLPYESAEVGLPAGGIIALYTDGLVEDRRQDIDVGLERIRRSLSRSRREPSLPSLCTAVIGTLPSSAPADDVTLLLARSFGEG
ncbi:SpoIIE family protein phosphatase [Streptomyces sp. NPDC048643]|uniref:SpoIIE family protein phosphatase n=1 Tax=Streptomyces sp. NPDC048643 TaxID=3155637 RepID=UPI00343271B8